ncbi:MarR family winged helix-turn-helix transcriptional regulator [Gordonia soli]|uniref:HTH marR-type domain-containing protein n=1 Tax=Gordonia soli NBRC 108243 TaxID=1223545 RepID=M0QP96_9ACTN|nr:MarR family transcriptional regulator [Gordonia soli]GAC70234.1 hypothetical protein GS4_33_00490 [Gordonia soli NBRC 108243]
MSEADDRRGPSGPSGQGDETGEPGVPTVSPAFLAMAVGRRVRSRIEDALRVEGLAMRHFSALGHLSRSDGISYSELARRASVTPQSMQSTLTALERKGAVTRTTDSGRGRTAHLVVTEEGRRLLAVGQTAIEDLDRALSDQLGAADVGHLAQTLLRAMQTIGPDQT